MLLGLFVGVSLAAACGFRVFVPLLVMSLAVRADYLTVAANMEWVGSTPALLALGTATALEIAGYYVPWVDNLLDSIATPAAVVAGTLATTSMITGMDPMLQWAVGIVAGGGTAGGVQLLTVITRAASSVTTAGLGNPGVATVELGAAFTLAVLAVLVPVVAIALVVLVLALLARMIVRRRRTRLALR